MKRNSLRKNLIIGIIILFVGAGVIPSISGDVDNTNSVLSVGEVREESFGYINDNDAESPIWKVGDSWTYEVCIDGGIEQFLDLDNVRMLDLKFVVKEVQADKYKLDLTADLTGSVEVELDIISLSGILQDVELEGTAFVDKSTLSVEKIEELHIEGYIKPPVLPRVRFEAGGNVNISYGVLPLDFPINVNESWNVDTIIMALNISVDILGQKIPVSLFLCVGDHSAQCVDWDIVKAENMEYDALRISGDLGEQNDIWYSLGAGNVVKVVGRDIPLSWGGYGYYDIDMELKSTTYQAPSDSPNTPSTPSGPTILDVGDSGNYSSDAVDPDGDKIRYIFDWDDGTKTSTDFQISGELATVSHTWNKKGNYSVRVKARDKYGKQSEWSDPLTVIILNTAPNKPSTPSGPTNGRVKNPYTYSTSTTDSDGHRIKYGFDWDGDDFVDEWTKLYNSGETASALHTWNKKGNYEIKVKARDEYGEESEWSDPLPISMPRNKAINSLFHIFEEIIGRFPLLKQMLQFPFFKI